MNKIDNVLAEIKKVIVGKDEVIITALEAVIAGGHILIDDIPGVGKTTLAVAMAKAMGLTEKRMQFTPDVMPSDVVGFSMYNNQSGTFEYREGAAMCNLFLGDEINRTSPKTQSALLEVMEEGRITVDGITREVPKPFIVIATQNPTGSIGTQMLPESQLDRFMIRISMGYPNISEEALILKNKGNNGIDSVQCVLSKEELLRIQSHVDNIYVDDGIYEYVARIAAYTRNNEYVRLGISPRGAIALIKMAKANAYIREHEYVLPSDVLAVITQTIGHRIIMSNKAKVDKIGIKKFLVEINNAIPMPEIAPNGGK